MFCRGLEENFNFLILEVGNQVNAIRDYLRSGDKKVLQQIVCKDDYIDNLKTILQKWCFDILTQADAITKKETDSIHAARNWLREKFIEFGYTDIDIQPFTLNITAYGIEYEDLRCYNVACLKTGTVYPEKLIVIGAHYDSYNHYGPSAKEVWSPGADDNASGTATVLELARVFKDFDSQYSMLFVPFSAEEIGLWGAQHCAELLYDDSTEIELMINFYWLMEFQYTNAYTLFVVLRTLGSIFMNHRINSVGLLTFLWI